MAQELKTYDFPVDHGDFTATVEQFYLKSEADKVIAEKDTEIAELKQKLQDHCIHCPVKEQEDDVVAEKDKQIEELKAKIERLKNELHYVDEVTEGQAGLAVWTYEQVILHHKYKRCLAMAKWCKTSARCDEGLGAFKYRDWYWKWFKRWLELAEKFKPNNSTAQ